MKEGVARLAGFEPATSASAGLRSIQLSYKRTDMVPREGFEPTRAFAHYALNVARLPFRHLGIWWAALDLNQRPPACEAGALTAELAARELDVARAGFEPAT